MILVLMLCPFVSFVTFGILNLDFNRVFILFSYIGVILVFFYSNRNNPIRFPTYLWFYLLFVVYDYYSTFGGILDRQFEAGYLFSNHRLGSFLILFIVENVPINDKHYEKLFKLGKNILKIAFVVIVIQQVINVNFFIRPDKIHTNITSSDNEDRLYSIYSWYGMYGPGLSFIPVFLLVIEDLDKRVHTQKLYIWILIGIVFALLSKARWIMINTILGFLVLVITKRNKFRYIFKYLTIVPVVLVFSFFALSIAGIDATGIVKERIFESGERKEKMSASSRLLAIKAFNTFYWKNPIYGVGNIKYGMGGTDRQAYDLQKWLKGRSSQIHVGYLSLFYMYGLIGGMFFVLTMVFVLGRLYRSAKRTRKWAPFLAILGFGIANLTLVTFSFLELGLIFAILSNKYFVEQHKKQQLKNPISLNA